jgi:hypothetical protein
MTFGEQCRSKRSSLISRYALPRHFVPLRPKCLPRHPILTHPQPVLLAQCDRRSLTPVQNKRQHYSSVYLDIYIFGSNWKAEGSAPPGHSAVPCCVKVHAVEDIQSEYRPKTEASVSFTLHQWKNPGVWEGPRASVNILEKRKPPFLCQGSIV